MFFACLTSCSNMPLHAQNLILMMPNVLITYVAMDVQESNQMTKYGLRPRTLKGELFTILLNRGSGGLKVSEVAKAPKVWLTGWFFNC